MDIFLNHIIRSNLISGNKTDLNPVKFGWNSVDSVLMAYKCNCYTTRDVHCYLWLQEKNALEDISAASLALYKQKFATASEKNFVPNFTNRFSRTLQKIWIWKYKGVLCAKFCRIWTESKDIGKIRIRKKLYIQIFYPL